MKYIQFDGGAIPNPGNMGIGVVLIDDNRIIKELSKKLDGVGTNNEAEYSALIEGLKQAIELGWKNICIQGDSKLVINQIKGMWKINKPHLRVLNNTVKELLNNFNSVEMKWIGREQNSRADAAASMALGFKEDPYHQMIKKDKTDHGSSCPKCGKECKFELQTFKNGDQHLKQRCPTHGFIRWAPKLPEYLEKVAEDKHVQKSMLDF